MTSASLNASASITTAYVSLGSNQGDTVANLSNARAALADLPGVAISAVSAVYQTEPQGMSDQPFFSNQVVALACDSSVRPEALLDMMLAIETSLGRVRPKSPDSPERFGPRSIDLDLLLFGNERIDTQHLVLPHPRMLERAFVLVPLAEIAHGLQLPQGMDVHEALKAIRYTLMRDIIFQKDGR